MGTNPKELNPGDKVDITCYQKGCEGVVIEVTLGALIDLPYLGLSAGRLSWPEESLYQGFELWEEHGGSGYCNCPNCNTLFGHVVAIFPPQGEPILYGYDPEPA